MGYAVKITSHAVDAVTGADKGPGIVAAESTSISTNLRKRFGSGDLRLRQGKDRVVRQGNGWVVEGGSPYGSYAGTPMSATFNGNSPLPSASPFSPGFPGSPHPHPPSAGTPRSASYGLGLSPHPASPALSPRVASSPVPGPRSSMLSPHTPGSPFPTAATAGTPYTPSGAMNGGLSVPNTPGLYAHFPPTPTPGSAGVGQGGSVFAAQQGGGPPMGPPRRSASNGSATGNGSVGAGKKDD